MDGYTAARKALSKCSTPSDRSIATFLARQYLIDARASLACLPEVEQLLNEWFATRESNPSYLPPEKAEVTSGFPMVKAIPLAYDTYEAAMEAAYEAENSGSL